MQKSDCFSLGYIRRTVKNDGSFIIYLDVDDPQQYATLDALLVETKTGLIPYMIDKISIRSDHEAMVHFQDINDEDTAELFKGKALWLPLEALPKLSDNQFYFHEVIGWKVIDETFGEVGTIQDIFDNVQYPLFQIIHLNGKEILMPITDSILKKIDKSHQTIYISAPEGLIDIYLENDENNIKDE
ncbi:MAG: ribosome maturation factor RimM [Bacteroidales bacterium]|nr:ribosome maturation factor RimM [Bacteroidales bacterium]